LSPGSLPYPGDTLVLLVSRPWADSACRQGGWRSPSAGAHPLSGWPHGRRRWRLRRPRPTPALLSWSRPRAPG